MAILWFGAILSFGATVSAARLLQEKILHPVELEHEDLGSVIHCVEKQELVTGGHRDCPSHHRLELGT